MTGNLQVIVSRHSGADASLSALEEELIDLLSSNGYGPLVVPHLYHLPHRSELWASISSVARPCVLAIALHPRPAGWLLREYAGIEPSAVIDLAACRDASEAYEQIEAALGPPVGDSTEPTVHEVPVAERWYPVIDRSRCTGCRHCLQFCLFGVYELDETGRVVAVAPDACKAGCPACSRVCPQGAIIFPLYDDPAIAGAPGTLMQPDAAARRMYYVRTGHPCPLCGRHAQAGDRAEATAANACEECGAPADASASSSEAHSPLHQEIDDLIDALDRLDAGPGGDDR